MSVNVNLMEPLMPPEASSAALEDLATQLITECSSLISAINPILAASLSDLVRSMNCYYSNLIEGHNTHPRDIDRAMEGKLSKDIKKRNLQLEAKAHIEIQKLIDTGQLPFNFTSKYIQELHALFIEQLPEELLWCENPDTQEKVLVTPGEYRSNWVQVGRHLPPAPDEIPAFIRRFEDGYCLPNWQKIRRIISIAASHHRLLWIHPFLDGNGRVARLFSHAFFSSLAMGSQLWSVSRGLARNVEQYKANLINADSPRLNDLDGRGNLSTRGLIEFCNFFLSSCLDQVRFMQKLIRPTELANRIELYTQEEIHMGRMPKGSWPILREVLLTGEMERGRAPAVTGYKERQARTILSELIKNGLLLSATPKGAVKLAFPYEILSRWLPHLYPA